MVWGGSRIDHALSRLRYVSCINSIKGYEYQYDIERV